VKPDLAGLAGSLLTVAALAAAAVPDSAHAVIDCSHARTNTEKLICSSTRLGIADEMMARAFRAAIHRGRDPRELMESQRKWIEERRDACNDVDCMLKAYEDRIGDLEAR
jgi:uncharacterized protein